MKRRHLASKAGFTLIEIVIALGIFGIVMAVGYSSLQGIISAKYALDDARDLRALADAILGRLTREIQLAVADVPLIPDKDKLDQPNSPKLNMLGAHDTLRGDASSDSLSFLALEGGQYLPDGGSHSGIVQISYRLAKDPEAAVGDEDSYMLIRDELPFVRPYQRAYDRIMTFPIATNILSLSFSYLDQQSGELLNTWGTDNKLGLPRLVRLSITLRSPKGQVETFTTSVPLRAKSQ
ncbi:MAG: prepilin-type N-terminal cleavage/methylation domain-containing protein [Oligoflexia bacterium]|nr:prepilin-type N-terminal cleavage/methylation domain-containing protein [Oligoflexia bacterium]